jgi:signal peptide peptidase SppA
MARTPKKSGGVSALNAALSAVWAMEERALETVLEIAAREHEVTEEALEKYAAKSLERAQQARVRDGVAIIDANGPLFRRANLMTAMSGATSYSIIMADLQAALDDPAVRAVMLNIDSPGGEVNGADELAQAIYAARGVKPIVAYVGGAGASAAYWVASAADSVVASPTAVLGSIGVQVAATVSAPKAGEKSYTFVSSQSPKKNPDIGTEAAATQIQQTIDAMAQVFVETVARNRGVATETVLTNFGAGGTFVGKAAVEAGLADSIGSFEAVLAELSAGHRRDMKLTGARAIMADQTFTAEERNAHAATAVAAERERVAALTKLASAHGANATELAAAIDGGVTVSAFAIQMADKAEAAAIAAAEAEAKATAEAEARAKTEEEARLKALKETDETTASAARLSGEEPPEAANAADKLANEIIAAAAAATGSK